MRRPRTRRGGPGREPKVSRLRTTLLPAVAALALVLAACGGEEESSGLATLVDEAPVVETVPEPEEVAASGIVNSPPETTETTATPTPETTATPTPETTAAANTGATPETSGTTAAAIPATVGGGGTGDVPSATTTTQPESSDTGNGSGEEDLTDEERLLRFADCMRENGVDFPDPVVEADGTVRFGFRPGTGGAGALQELGRDPDLPAAREACEDLLEGLSFGPGSGNFDTTELQDTLLEFARCMRDNGVDMGDPDLSNFGRGGGDDGPGGGDDGPGGGPFGDAIDFGDPDVAAALEVCQEEVDIRFGGGGRGRNS